jgi:hypothetical protein
MTRKTPAKPADRDKPVKAPRGFAEIMKKWRDRQERRKKRTYSSANSDTIPLAR